MTSAPASDRASMARSKAAEITGSARSLEGSAEPAEPRRPGAAEQTSLAEERLDLIAA